MGIFSQGLQSLVSCVLVRVFVYSCPLLIVFVSVVYYSELARDAIPGTEPGIRRRQNQD